MAGVVVRPLRQEDTEVVRTFFVEQLQAFGHAMHLPSQTIAQWVQQSLETDMEDPAAYYATGGFWVAVPTQKDDEVVGMVGLDVGGKQLLVEERPEAELRRLYVRSDQQRRGVGRALIEACVTACRVRGIPTIFLYVSDDNASSAANALYTRCGFTLVEQREIVDVTRVLVNRYERQISPSPSHNGGHSLEGGL